ncbi:MAG: glutamine--fructose-6-phosphate transaminase (isomerizing), partial [Sulfolobales archaeon]
LRVCGIIGVTLARQGVLGRGLGEIIGEILKRLEYRGYDSVGYALITSKGDLIVRKAKGKIDELYEKLEFSKHDGICGFGHTRWATHGPPSDKNAHPHSDCDGCILVVHNGVIQNYQELREILSEEGHEIRSDTDTELIAHLIEKHYKETGDMLEALRRTVSNLKGAYAFLSINCRDKRIYFAKNLSPLIIGLGSEFNMIASDIPAVLGYTSRVIVLRDGELGYISPEEVYIEDFYGRSQNISERIRYVEWQPEMISRGGFRHFMLKEIFEQPTAILQTLAGLKDQIPKIMRVLRESNRIFITGAGSSYHAGLVLDYALKLYLGISSTAFIASEIALYEKVFKEEDLLIAISQSGETIDTLSAVRIAKERGAKVLAISNVIESAIPRESDYVLYTRAGPEIGVGATKTFTTQVASLLYLVGEIARGMGLGIGELLIREILSSPEYIEKSLGEIDRMAEKLAEILESKTSSYVLGRDASMPVSMEGALKLKEIAYIHAEAYPAGESKHGPIALVEKDFPVFFTVFGFRDHDPIISNVEEMKARNAMIISIQPRDYDRLSKLSDFTFPMPRMRTIAASIPYVIPYQLTAYHLAVRRGFDPDKPRNLAKTVTVE